jgi:hypothetical protein
MAGKVTDAVGKLAIVAAVAILGGCKTDGDHTNEALTNFLVGEYSNIEVVELQLGAETFRVFDKPSASKMIITKGMRWTLVHGTMPTAKEPFEAAAVQYLANTGRSSCRVTDVSAIIGPKHEIKYACTPPASAAAKRKG